MSDKLEDFINSGGLHSPGVSSLLPEILSNANSIHDSQNFTTGNISPDSVNTPTSLPPDGESEITYANPPNNPDTNTSPSVCESPGFSRRSEQEIAYDNRPVDRLIPLDSIDSGNICERTNTESHVPDPSPAPPISKEELTPTRAKGFDFLDPYEMLLFLDDDLSAGKANGGYDLHPWQIQFMRDFAHTAHCKDSPFQAVVNACNGSGKDKYIVAACAVWICMAFIRARAVATNGSGHQLDSQTEPSIRWLCEQANLKIHPSVWKCNYRYYACLATASPIDLFATDEPKKAEGHHPYVTKGKLAIFTSESKSIPDNIFEALERCHGFTHRVDVSSPGEVFGYFYDKCSTALLRKEVVDIKSVDVTQKLLYQITAYDCPHITPAEMRRMASNLAGGETSAVYRSSMLAEFGSTEAMVVIPYTYIWRAVNSVGKSGHIEEPFNKAGLDLSDGGDETVLVVRNGNKLLKVLPFRFDNTEDTIAFLNEKFREYGLTNPEAFIYADAGGLGKPMLDRMRRQGWSNIRYFDNRYKAYEPRTYKNRGSESWFHIRKLLERHELILYSDKVLIKQLSTRYYKIIDGRIHQLLSKIESRSKGYPSPDRADALVLAFCDYKSTWVESTSEENKPYKQPPPPKHVSEFNLTEYCKREIKESPFERHPSRRLDLSMLREDIAEMNKQILCKTGNKE